MKKSRSLDSDSGPAETNHHLRKEWIFLIFLIVLAAALIFSSRHYLAQTLKQSLIDSVENLFDISLEIEQVEMSLLDISKARLKHVEIQAYDSKIEPILKVETISLHIGYQDIFKRTLNIDFLEANEAAIYLNAKRLKKFRTRYLKKSSPVSGTLKPKGFALNFGELQCRACNLNIESSFKDAGAVYKLSDAGIQMRGSSENRGVFSLNLAGLLKPDGKDVFAVIQYDAAQDQADFKVSYDREAWMFESAVTDLTGSPDIRGQLDLLAYQTEDFQIKDGLALSGAVTAEIRLATQGASLAEWKQHLSAEGVADIREGSVRSLNVVRENLEPIVQQLGRSDIWQNKAFSDYDYMFKEDSLDFKRLTFDFQILEDQVLIDGLKIFDKNYVVEMEGSYEKKAREADFGGELILLDQLSGKWVQGLPAFSKLINEHGRIVVPFVYRGIEPYLKMKPDMSVFEAPLENFSESLQKRG